MRVHTFFIENTELHEGEELRVMNTDMLHQWVSVFRMRVGDPLRLADNLGFIYTGVIRELSKKEAVVFIEGKEPGKDSARMDLSIFSALIKKDKFEWVVQKGTEIGVASFIPVLSEHSEKKDVNLDRLKIIAREAAEQCGRGHVPDILNMQTLADCLAQIKMPLLVLHGSGAALDIGNLKETYRGMSLGILIGPEGGWSDKEISLFREKNIPIFSLGERTLRAETAAVAVSALLLL